MLNVGSLKWQLGSKKRSRPNRSGMDKNGLKELTGCPAGPFSIKGLH